jgi:preprotein translocase subunit SecG
MIAVLVVAVIGLAVFVSETAGAGGAAIFGATSAIALAVGRFRNNEAQTVPWP